ncbi:putative signal transducing protein, partial [Idiomarina abyssalis]
MKLIYTRENKLLVENARNLLQMEGIETVMKNEFSSG